MSPTSSSPSKIRKLPVSVTTPIAVPWTSHLSVIAITASTLSGVTTQSIRSWDSETITSNGSSPSWRRGTSATSRSRPTSPFDAISDAADVRPAAPRSCSDTSRSLSSSSNEHSTSLLSSNGSPTCTVGRLSASSSPSSADASTDAPPMPSAPVEAPNSTMTLPTPVAAERISRSSRTRPSAIALTRQLVSYGPSK